MVSMMNNYATVLYVYTLWLTCRGGQRVEGSSVIYCSTYMFGAKFILSIMVYLYTIYTIVNGT